MKKILVIEDDRDICELIEMILEEEYTVSMGNSISEAKKTTDINSFDLIIIDHVLNQETADILIKEYKKKKFLVISAFSKSNTKITKILADYPSVSFLQKPFDVGTLRNRVKSLL